MRSRKLSHPHVGFYQAKAGQVVEITEHPHETPNGEFPDGFKLEFDDGQIITVDGEQTVTDYIAHLGLIRLLGAHKL